MENFWRREEHFQKILFHSVKFSSNFFQLIKSLRLLFIILKFYIKIKVYSSNCLHGTDCKPLSAEDPTLGSNAHRRLCWQYCRSNVFEFEVLNDRSRLFLLTLQKFDFKSKANKSSQEKLWNIKVWSIVCSKSPEKKEFLSYIKA